MRRDKVLLQGPISMLMSRYEQLVEANVEFLLNNKRRTLWNLGLILRLPEDAKYLFSENKYEYYYKTTFNNQSGSSLWNRGAPLKLQSWLEKSWNIVSNQRTYLGYRKKL